MRASVRRNRSGRFCHRWYEPQTGRYSADDPLGGGSTSGYAYAGNNPIANTDPLGLVTVFQTYYFDPNWMDPNRYVLDWGRWFGTGRCVCDVDGWKIRLKLHFNHRFLCQGDTSCGREAQHMNIAWSYIVRAAQHWNQYEQVPYDDQATCERMADFYARDMEDNIFFRDPDLFRYYRETQRLYEDTHHGWLCNWVGGLCGADQ